MSRLLAGGRRNWDCEKTKMINTAPKKLQGSPHPQQGQLLLKGACRDVPLSLHSQKCGAELTYPLWPHANCTDSAGSKFGGNVKILLCSVMHGNINKSKPLALDFLKSLSPWTVFFLKSFLSEGKKKKQWCGWATNCFCKWGKQNNFTEIKHHFLTANINFSAVVLFNSTGEHYLETSNLITFNTDGPMR